MLVPEFLSFLRDALLCKRIQISNTKINFRVYYLITKSSGLIERSWHTYMASWFKVKGFEDPLPSAELAPTWKEEGFC